MTEPSQYFKGRTVQEQMNEVIGYVDTRAAEVATTAIASDVAQVHQDKLDADADASAAAASAAAAAGTLANAVKKTGEASQSIAGNIAVSGNLTGGTVTVPAPVNNTDAANKKYVDDHHDATKLDVTAVGNYAVLLTGNQDNISGNKGWLGMQTLKAQYPKIRASTTDTPSNFQIEMMKEGDTVPVSRILLDKDTQYSGQGNTTHHLVVIGGRHTDRNGVTHDVGLRLSYNETTGKFVLSMNGVTITEVVG